MQSGTTPDPGHHTDKWQTTIKYHTQESQEVSPFPAGDHKAALNRQERMTNTKQNNENDPQKKNCLGIILALLLWKFKNSTRTCSFENFFTLNSTKVELTCASKR